MEALKTEHFWSQCCGNKGKQRRQVVEFMNRACLWAEQLKLMNITQASSWDNPGRWNWEKTTTTILLCRQWGKNQGRWMLERVFVPLGELHHISSLILKGGGKRGKKRKSDLSFNGQLMMSYHYTQILWSPSKPAPLHADWLAACERGRVFFSLSCFCACELISSFSPSHVTCVKTTVIHNVGIVQENWHKTVCWRKLHWWWRGFLCAFSF